MAEPNNNSFEYVEGEIYEVIEIAGYKFDILCGYRTKQDKKAGVVLPIYPNFIKSPKYTNEGYPLVTCMQNSCRHYEVIPDSDIENKCIDCKYFNSELRNVIGICKAKKRMKKTKIN